MDHVAIMKRGVGSIRDIISGKKTIESRWYVTRRAPWGRIKAGDRVFFKYSSKEICARAEVERVMQIEINSKEVLNRIIKRYGGQGLINLKNRDASGDYFKKKKYCILIFLTGAKNIKEFNINKKGYGNAWFIAPQGIERMKVKE